MSSSRLYRISGIVLIIAIVVGTIDSIISAFVFPDTGPSIPLGAVTSIWRSYDRRRGDTSCYNITTRCYFDGPEHANGYERH